MGDVPPRRRDQGENVEQDRGGGPVGWGLLVFVSSGVLGFLVGALFVMGALYNLWFLDGVAVVYILGFLVLALTSALAVSLIVFDLPADRLERIRGGKTLVQARDKLLPKVGKTGRVAVGVVLIVIGGALLGGLVYAGVLINDLRLGTPAVVVYVVASAAGAVLIVVVRLLLPAHTPTSNWGKRTSLGLLGGAVGLVLSVVAAFVVFAISSHSRQDNLADTEFPRLSLPHIAGSYVSLGDSYAAGEGLPVFEPDPEVTSCHRSVHYSYARLLDATIGPGHPATAYRACAGAVVHDMYALHGLHVPAQVQPGTADPNVGLVSVMVGGNDVFFSKIVTFCFERGDCVHARFAPGDAAMMPSAPLWQWAPVAMHVLAGREATLYGQLRASYPNARIVVIGYPYLFPAGHAPLALNDCTSVLRRFSVAERGWIRDRTDDLNNLLYAEAVNAGLEFVSPTDAWAGHEPCGSKGQYTNSIKPIFHVPNPVDGGSFHPNRNGQHELAVLIASYLTSHAQPPYAFADGHAHVLDIGTDYCPSHLGLVQPPGEATEHCPPSRR